MTNDMRETAAINETYAEKARLQRKLKAVKAYCEAKRGYVSSAVLDDILEIIGGE